VSLNLKNQKSNGSRVPQDNIEVGAYPARVVRVLDLGMQPGGEFEGKMKPNAYKVDFTYELLDCFMKDKDGKINYYDTEEDACLTCGMYEFENAWVMKLIYNHIEKDMKSWN